MMNCIRNNYAVLFLVSLGVLVLLAGCSTPVYDTLKPIPEYPQLSKSFDTTAIIQYVSFAQNQSGLQLLIDPTLQKAFIRNGYSTLLTDVNYTKDFSKTVHVFSPMNFSHKILKCEDGKYLEMRLIVMVRSPGNVWWDKLNFSDPRFFQAYARYFLGDNKLTAEIFQEVFDSMVNNLFTIESFRQALEPQIATEPSAIKQTAGEKLISELGSIKKHDIIRWAFVAAEHGDNSAEKLLSAYLLANENICGDNKRLAEVLTRLAENEHVNAQLKLADLYENGFGVNKDCAKAFYWYLKAAEQNSAAAQYKVGKAFEGGIGVDRNIYNAEIWYSKAAKQKYDPAIKSLKILQDSKKVK